MAYEIALPIVTGYIGAIVNYGYTGHGPQELKDYFFPRTKIHEFSVANGLPQSEEPACDDRISTRIGSDKAMLGRIEQRNFQDVGALFEEFCKKWP